MWYDAKKLTKAIKSVKQNRKTTYKKMADAIGIDPAHLSYTLNGKRNFSPETLNNFCEKFNIDPDSLKPEAEETTPFKIGTVINQRMKELGLTVAKLSKQTNIEIFDLFKIVGNQKEPSQSELKQIAKALDVNPKFLQDNNIVSTFFQIRTLLEDNLNMKDDAISAIIAFIESQL